MSVLPPFLSSISLIHLYIFYLIILNNATFSNSLFLIFYSKKNMTSFFPLFYKVSGHIYFLTFFIFLVFTARFIRNRPFNQLHLPIHEVIFYGIFILVDNGSIICVKVEKREVSAICFYFP